MQSSMRRIIAQPSRGYTLVETMIVVVIVGVLASLATYGVRRYIRRAKSAEARQMILSIKAGEESYREETYKYLSTTSDSEIKETSLFPQKCRGSVPSATKWSWEQEPNADCAKTIRTLGIGSTGPVQYGYAAVAVNAKESMPSIANSSWSWGALSVATGPAYAVAAMGDLDGNLKYSVFISSSLSDEIYAENEDE